MRGPCLGAIAAGFGIVVGVLAVPAAAAVLVDFNLSSVPNVAITSATATTVASGLTASLLTRGPGLTAFNLTRGFSAQGWNNSGLTQTTRSDAISGNKYYAFDLTIAAGSTASFSDISVSLYKSAISSPASIEWQYSFDNFVTTGSTLVAFNHYGRNNGSAPNPLVPFQWMSPPYNNGGGPVAIDTGSQTNGNNTGPIDISTISALQNVAGPATVSFRLYGWGQISGTTTTTNTLAIGRDAGPLINGTITSVPEPSGVVLAVAGVGLAIGCSVRSRRSCPPPDRAERLQPSGDGAPVKVLAPGCASSCFERFACDPRSSGRRPGSPWR